MKKFALILAVLLALTLVFTACDNTPTLPGTVHEGSFYKITLPEGWSGDPGMYNYDGNFNKSLSISDMDKVDGLDKEKAAEFLEAEDSDIVTLKIGKFDAFKYFHSGEEQKITSYIFSAHDFTAMIYYNTDEIDDAVITAIEAMEIFEKKNDEGNGNGGGIENPLGNPDPALAAIIEKLYKDVANVPKCENWEVKADNFKSFLFIDYIEGSKAVASEAQMIVSNPHGVVLLELPEGADVKAVAAEIEAKAELNKWICVSAEKAGVFTNGQYVVLVMSFKNIVDGIGANVSEAFSGDDVIGINPL